MAGRCFGKSISSFPCVFFAMNFLHYQIINKRRRHGTALLKIFLPEKLHLLIDIKYKIRF